jgi:hypothetical protein
MNVTMAPTLGGMARPRDGITGTPEPGARRRRLYVAARRRVEPWDRTVTRLLSPESLIVGLSYVPSMH